MIDRRGLWPLIEARAAETPDGLFAVDEQERRLTFRGYRDAALRCAAGLAQRGVGAGTTVSWQLPTRFESMLLVAALARLGAVQNPILPMLRRREVGFMTRQSGARLLVVPPEWRGFDHAGMARTVAADQPGLQVLVQDGPLPEGDPGGLPEPPSDVSDEDAPVRWLFFTSGTTAEPKGARHTDATLAAAGRAMVSVLELRPDDRVALVFPFTHVGGINWLFAGLLAGCAHIVVPAFDPATSIDMLARHGVTQATAGTVFHQAYLAAQRERGPERLFPEVRAFPGGGAPKPPDLFFDVKHELGGAGIVSGYGMTECPIVVMGTLRDPEDKLAHTEGRATPGVEIRIVGAAGEELGEGQEGEVRVRGPQLFRGYLDAELDAQAFDEAGFLRTGDLGRLDADGYLTITGRIKDVILRKGETLSAKEIEDHLHAHPAVTEASVVGLPDSARGELACAVIAPADPAAPPSLAALAEFLRERGLANQKIPEQLEIVEALPRNPAGKVLKSELRERYST